MLEKMATEGKKIRETEKKCKTCGIVKKPQEFYKTDRGMCIECKKAYTRERYYDKKGVRSENKGESQSEKYRKKVVELERKIKTIEKILVQLVGMAVGPIDTTIDREDVGDISTDEDDGDDHLLRESVGRRTIQLKPAKKPPMDAEERAMWAAITAADVETHDYQSDNETDQEHDDDEKSVPSVHTPVPTSAGGIIDKKQTTDLITRVGGETNQTNKVDVDHQKHDIVQESLHNIVETGNRIDPINSKKTVTHNKDDRESIGGDDGDDGDDDDDNMLVLHAELHVIKEEIKSYGDEYEHDDRYKRLRDVETELKKKYKDCKRIYDSKIDAKPITKKQKKVYEKSAMENRRGILKKYKCRR
jgi:hypothetical protein